MITESNSKNIHASSKSSEWETPQNLFDSLNKEFNFVLDAAATEENAKCPKFFTKSSNALVVDWSQYKRVFCNPPYGREIGKFVKKAYEESLKGCIVALLIPSRTDTKWFSEYCSKGEIRFIKGRLKFINRTFPSYRTDGNFIISPAPFPSCIVIFGNGKTGVSWIKKLDQKYD